jgi:uncharacterized protein Yka (UPF0111/DUF47 family)
MGIISRIFEAGEKKIIDRSVAIIDIALESNRILGDIIKKSERSEAIRSLDNKADSESFALSNLIISGAIAPNLINSMIALVHREEEIVDSIFNLSRHLLRYELKSREYASYMGRSLEEMNLLADSAIKLLHKMHGTDEIRKLKGLRHRVKALENDGDVIKDAMLDFAYSSKAGFKDFYFIIDAAYLSDDILDSCEDASDIFISIMTSIIT